MQTGDVLRGKYRLTRLLGDGGMGSVYEANHEGLGTRVAIKVLHSDLARRPGLVERFLREARVSAQIKSPNVVQVMDVDTTDDGVAYIVMELLEGQPLSAILEREGRVAIDLATEYTIQILRALEAAHALGVVHRDLKPENAFITVSAGKPVLKLIDFGIAKARQMDSQSKNLTVAGIVMGTPEYMAPEQAHSADKVDARSDLYAVGVMLYEMIAGARPATGDDARIVALKVERGEIKPLVHAAPGVPPELAGLVHRAMAFRPELRHATATEMRLALEGVAGKRGTSALAGAPSPSLAGGRPPHVEGAAPASVLGAQAGPTNPAGPPGFASSPPPGRGTVISDPTGEALRPGGPPPGAYGPGGYGVSPQTPAGGPGRMSAYGAYGGGYTPDAAAARARAKKRSSMTWLLIALPIALGAVIVLAFAIGGAGGGPAPQPTMKTVPPTPTPVSIAPTQTTPSPSPAAPDTVAPLTPAAPIPHMAPQPGVPSSAKPHPSPSASASGAPSASTAEPSSPFPFPSLPAIPNPFPSPSSSGVGPVITIPTSLPFPFPGAPAPAPSHGPAPAPSGGKPI